MSKKLIPELIPAKLTYDLRQRLLRPGQPLSQCMYAEDEAPSTFHLGLQDFESRKIISNGTFIQQGHDLFPTAKKPYRLRGMATDLPFQRQGLGQKIIHAALVELKLRHCDLLWFNARTSAEKFYLKLGFTADDKVFELPLIGPHKVMYKWL